MAGHNKWKQIKHKKALTDAKKGAAFSRIVREITVAAREGGASPDSNIRLRAAMDRARSEGLPKDNIERALLRARGQGDAQELFEFLYEAVGPSGTAILIEGITDSTNRTFNELRHLLSEHACRLAEAGSLLWSFEKIGALTVTSADNPGKTADEIETAIIESGALNYARHEDANDTWDIETAFGAQDAVRRELLARHIAVADIGHDYKPRSPITLPPDAAAALEKILDAILDYDDVQEIYTNARN